ncbi:hypothetical protein [Peribacillus sp. SCS-155]|uniref:hypothetical protein n=1 Tax=Peribacillus sedimenti TaxID=3115297 RepID=UPI003906096E
MRLVHEYSSVEDAIQAVCMLQNKGVAAGEIYVPSKSVKAAKDVAEQSDAKIIGMRNWGWGHNSNIYSYPGSGGLACN